MACPRSSDLLYSTVWLHVGHKIRRRKRAPDDEGGRAGAEKAKTSRAQQKSLRVSRKQIQKNVKKRLQEERKELKKKAKEERLETP